LRIDQETEIQWAVDVQYVSDDGDRSGLVCGFYPKGGMTDHWTSTGPCPDEDPYYRVYFSLISDPEIIGKKLTYLIVADELTEEHSFKVSDPVNFRNNVILYEEQKDANDPYWYVIFACIALFLMAIAIDARKN
jgi:hypothetical protein